MTGVHIAQAYVMSFVFSMVITSLLAIKLGDFPENGYGRFKIHLIWLIPVVNVIYGLAIIPYFFFDNPYGIRNE
jgi:hypothetical protein